MVGYNHVTTVNNQSKKKDGLGMDEAIDDKEIAEEGDDGLGTNQSDSTQNQTDSLRLG